MNDISTKYTIVLSCTHLHVYIRTSLVMYMHSRRMPTIMTSSLHARRAVACVENPSETVLHFCSFLLNPYFDLEPDYIIRKPIKRTFQRYITIWKYSQLFMHESNTIRHSAHSNQWDWCAQTHTRRHTNENIISTSFPPFTWRV